MGAFGRSIVHYLILMLLLLSTTATSQEEAVLDAAVQQDASTTDTKDATNGIIDGLEIGEEEPVPAGSSSVKHPNPLTADQEIPKEHATMLTEEILGEDSSSSTTTTTAEETVTKQETASTTGVEDGASSSTETEELAHEGTDTTTKTTTVTEEGTGASCSTDNSTATTAETADDSATARGTTATPESSTIAKEAAPVQAGPLIDLLGPQLLSLEMIDETHAQLTPHYTSDALRNKKVVGLYFSADWCGPCRKFTPELVAFYNKMNERRGKKNEFEIVWISRCRDTNSYAQYFTHMPWVALPPEIAMGEHGKVLSEKYKVKGIPHLVLLDEIGNVITLDARNKIPQDKAGIGFPWRNPIANLYVTIFPRSVRLMLKSQVLLVKDNMLQRVKRILGLQRPPPSINK